MWIFAIKFFPFVIFNMKKMQILTRISNYISCERNHKFFLCFVFISILSDPMLILFLNFWYNFLFSHVKQIQSRCIISGLEHREPLTSSFKFKRWIHNFPNLFHLRFSHTRGDSSCIQISFYRR